jgi:SAM-dependent methyltransferase
MPALSPTPSEGSTIATLERRAEELRRERSWFERLLRLAFPQQAKLERLLLASLSALGKEAARDREVLTSVGRQTARLELLTASLRNALRACEATISEQDQASAKNYGDALRRLLRLDQLAEETRSDLAALGRVQAGAADHLTRLEQLQASTAGAIKAEIAALQLQQAQTEKENVAQVGRINGALAELAALGQAQAGTADRLARLEELQASASGSVQKEIAALQAQMAQAETENAARLVRSHSALGELQVQMVRQQQAYEEKLVSFREQVAVLAAQVADVGSAGLSTEFAAQMNLLDQRLQAMESERVAAAPNGAGLGSFASRMLAVEATLPALQRALAARTSAWPSAEERADATTESAFEHFYLEFENRYRGARQEIASRQGIYLPYLKALGVLSPGLRTGARLVDLGCGRGEWLQLLLDAGATGAVGVDRGAEMIDLCRGCGLPVEQGDALDFLRRQPDRSLAAITALHLVEHLPFPVLLAILGEARRVLEPRGLLIMETPNCGNLLVASQNFHLDPTHRSPVPPLLLSFSVEHAGFQEIKTLLLHPYSLEHRVDDSSALADRFNGFFYGPQDYAIVAYNA